MPLLEDTTYTTSPFDQTFGTDPLLDGISKDDPLSTQKENAGYGSEDDVIPDSFFGEDVPESGVSDLGSSGSDDLPGSSSADEAEDGVVEGNTDPLTKEPLSSDTSSVIEDTEGDPLINPGLAADDATDEALAADGITAVAADEVLAADGITDETTDGSSVANLSNETTDNSSVANLSNETTDNSSVADSPDETTDESSVADISDDETTDDSSVANLSVDETTDDSSVANLSDETTDDSSVGELSDDDTTDDSSVADISDNDSNNVTSNVTDEATTDVMNLKPDFDIGVFKVDSSGEVGIDFLFDGGAYKGQVAIVSMSGMTEINPQSPEFIREAALRAISNSEQGYIVIDDHIEAGRFTGRLGERNYTQGSYQGVKNFTMNPGDEFFLMLVPNGTVQQVLDNPNAGGALRPLFSLATANPDDAYHVGQIADITGDGSAFAWEDIRVDRSTDGDYNDIILQVRGAKAKAALMDDVVNPSKDWRGSDLGQALIEYVKAYITPDLAADDDLAADELVDDADDLAADELVDDADDLAADELVDADDLAADELVDADDLATDELVDDADDLAADELVDDADDLAADELVDDADDLAADELDELVDDADDLAADEVTDDVDDLATDDVTDGTTDNPSAANQPDNAADNPSAANQPKKNQPLIGVIDTGFSANNPDIDYSQITWGRDYVDGDDDPTLAPGEGNEHGTHVLGIIAAKQDNDIGIDGINPDAPIWAGRAVGSGKWAESLVEFVDAARESGQPNAVVNLSMDLTQIDADGNVSTRYEFTPLEMAALEYARQNNVLVAVAAGNDGGVMSALGQASQQFDNIITVGAAEQINDQTSAWKGFDRAEFSSYGNGLDIIADSGTLENPVMSTVGDGLGAMNGTSVATAKVTGAISQVWAANPELNYRQVIDILKSTATDLKTPNPDLETGSGLLNMAAAIPLAKATKSEEYNPDLQVVPITWSGEGKVTPMEREVNYSYQMKSGDTLWGIAQRELGSGSRWTEITKDLAGTTLFTSAEASQLPVGQVVYLPGNDPNQSSQNNSQPETPTSSTQDQAKQAALSNFLNAFGNVQSASFSDFLKGMFENFYSNPGATLNSQASEQGTGNLLTASFTTTATQSSNTLAGKKILLDPGHGITNTGFDPGAGGNGTTEAKENLHQANLIANHLRSLGAEVKVLDEPLSLAQIGQRAAGHDIFVSLHQNAFNGNAQGHEVYSHPNAPTKDAQLAQAINSELDAIFPDSVIPNRGTKKADFSVLRNAPTAIPAVLVESLFIDAPGMSRGNIETAATAVARGIEKFFTGQVTGSTSSSNNSNSSTNSSPIQSGVVNSKVESLPLNFRDNSYVGASIIGKLSKGTSLKILKSVTGGSYNPGTGPRNDWYQVEVNGQTGYVAGYYVDVTSSNQLTSKPGYVNGNVGGVPLNFRSSPKVGASIIGKLSQGSSLTILEKVSGGAYYPGNRTDWYKVKVGNQVGYVAAYYVSEGSNNGGGSGGYSASRDQFFNSIVGTYNIQRRDTTSYKGECVSFAARYVQDVYLPVSERSKYVTYGNGKDTASVVSQKFSQYFEPATSAGLPKRGAIISFPDLGNINGVNYGHVAVVTDSRTLSNGQRQVKIMDSNGPQGKVVKQQTYWINVPDGRANGYGRGIYWTNPRT